MNRPGQPQQQRPPNLAPAPGMGPFRGPPYPGAYGLPPRNVMPPYPGMPNHRQQNMLPQPSPGFIPPRGTNAFPFGAASLQQQQQQQSQQQSQQQGSLQAQQAQQAQSQQQQQPQQLLTPGVHSQPPSSAPPHSNTNLPQHLLNQTGSAPGMNGPTASGTAASSTTEGALDPNEFPALGSSPSANPPNPATTPGTGLSSSYASQAGTGVSLSSTTTGGNAPREFNAEEFPALGSQPPNQTQQPTQSMPQQPSSQPQPQPNQSTDSSNLNGFSSQDQHRPNLLSALQPPGLGPQPTPGNLQAQQRFVTEADKRNYAIKLGQAQANQASWPQPQGTTSSSNPLNAGPQSLQQLYPQNANGTNGLAPSQPPLGAPPGVPTPSFPHQSSNFAQSQTSATGPQYLSTLLQQGQPQPLPDRPPSQTLPPHLSLNSNILPETPAQQILLSPADRWGLLGLIALVKSNDPDLSLLAVGTDLATMGLDMNSQGNLYSSFITPWADASAAAIVEPEFHLPSCYNVHTTAPGPAKAQTFGDETLFFMFYSSPRDALQEVAAQELYNRNWRFHKDFRMWLTKETGTIATAKTSTYEQGIFTFFDPDRWEKVKKEARINYDQLEEKNLQPIPGFGGQMQPNAPIGQIGQQIQQMQAPSNQTPGQVAQMQTRSYQALPMAGLAGI